MNQSEIVDKIYRLELGNPVEICKRIIKSSRMDSALIYIKAVFLCFLKIN